MRLRLSDRYSVAITDATGYLEIAARMTPWSGPGQAVAHAWLLADPAGQRWRSDRDAFGNRVDTARLPAHPMQLTVTAIADITVGDGTRHPAPIPQSADHADGALTRPCPAIARFARDLSRHATDDARALLHALAVAVGRAMRYAPSATTPATTAAEAFAAGAGVCQDFAHVTIAAARSLGLPAYYVGGYVATCPGDATQPAAWPAVPHAWVAVPDGGATPMLVDPSEPTMARRYIPVACGRDFADVQPIRIKGPGARFRSWRTFAQVERL